VVASIAATTIDAERDTVAEGVDMMLAKLVKASPEAVSTMRGMTGKGGDSRVRA
jgi:hypothetical protein